MSWRRILLLSLVLVVLMVAGTWFLLQRSSAPARILQRELQAALLPAATLGSVRLELGRGRVHATDLRIDDPKRTGQALLAAAALEVDVGIDPFGTLLAVDRLVVDGFQIDLGPELPTAADLLRSGSGGSARRPRPPAVELRRGNVRWTVRAGEPPLVLDELRLTALPLADRPNALRIEASAHVREPALELRFDGELDATTGEVRAALQTGNLAIDHQLVLRLTRLFGVTAPEVAPSGRLQQLTATAWLPGSGALDRSPDVKLAAELADVAVTGGGLPAIVRDARVSLTAGTRDGGRAVLRLDQQGRHGELAIEVEATRWAEALGLAVRLRGTGVPIDDETLKSLQLFSAGAAIQRGLRPAGGRADIDLFLQNPHRGDADTELDLRLFETAVAYHGFGDGNAAFPLPIVAKTGRVRMRRNVIVIDGVDAEVAAVAGGGRVRLTGRVDTSARDRTDTTIDIVGDDVLFCPELRSALGELLADDGALYDRFAPVGRTAVAVQIRPRHELPGGWTVEVQPAAASMQWAGFPYRLDDLRGSLRADDDDVTFDLSGRHGAGRLAMRGHIPIGSDAGDAPGFDAVVTLRDIVVDDELRAAVAVLAPEIDTGWRQAQPNGQFHAEVKVWRPRPEDPLFHDARLDLAGLDLALPAAPWRATGLHGQVVVQGAGSRTRIDFDALRGRLEHGGGSPAELAMLGFLAFGDDAATDLAFVVRDLVLDDQLGRTLDELQALDRAAWDALRPSGSIDLVCDHRRDAAGADDLGIVVHLVDVTSAAPILPRPAEHLTGELRIASGELRFDDVRAVLGDARVQCSAGHVRALPAPDGRTAIDFTVRANGIDVDDGLANLFAGPLRQAVLERQLHGRADVDGLRLRFAVPRPGTTGAYATTIGGRLRLFDVDMTLGSGADGIRVEDISGIVDLADSTVGDAGGALTGALRNCSLRLFEQPFEALDAEFRADERMLALPMLQSRLHGGLLQRGTGDGDALQYQLPTADQPDGRLTANLDFERVDVYAFLEACGWLTPPYSGQARGQVQLIRLDDRGVLDAEGSGALAIDRADLGAVPLFTAIYAQLPAADRPRFDALDTKFRFGDRSVQFDQLEVRSNLLAAKGKGSLGLDGYLDIEMKLDNLLGATADPLLMPLIEYLASNIVTFDLYGYLRDLKAEKRWLTQRAPGRQAVLPMPPALPPATPPGF
jgi:hypothetical protein